MNPFMLPVLHGLAVDTIEGLNDSCTIAPYDLNDMQHTALWHIIPEKYTIPIEIVALSELL